MKIVTALLFIGILQVSANSNAQQLTYHNANATLKDVFKAIKRQTGYDVLYQHNQLDADQKIKVRFVDTSLEDVMKACLVDKALEFTFYEKFIVIKQRLQRASISPVKIQDSVQIRVTGRVTDAATDLPLLGAVVQPKRRSTSGTVTDAEGNFKIRVDENATLVLSFMGYAKKEVPVNGRTVIDVQMEVDVSELNDVMINAGYWKVSRRESTGNIARVTAEDIENQPVTSPIAALQGRMAGVEITEQSGMPGAAPRIRIRGQNSLRRTQFDNGNLPLYVIDGIPVSSNSISVSRGALSFAGVDPLNTLNLSNIESVEVLKDADATAIYGSRGGNGVVLITTKRGRPGKPTLELNVYSGAGKVPRFIDMLNTQQYLEMRREAFANDGVVPTSANAKDLLEWDTTRYTDWQRELIGGTAPFTNVQAALSGGNTFTSYRLGSSYSKQGLVLPGNFYYEKLTGFFNINHDSKDKKLQTMLSVNYGLDKNHSFGGSSLELISAAVDLPPNAPALYDENGELNWENSSWQNPLRPTKQPQELSANGLNINSLVNYQLFSGLKLKVRLGYNSLKSEELVKEPASSQNPAFNSVNRTYLRTTTTDSWIIEPQLTYSRKIREGNLDVLLGTTFQKRIDKDIALTGRGFTDESLMEHIPSADTRTISQSLIEYAYTAAFARVAYHWREKYFLNLTGRRDGSSRFGPSKRFANFGAIGAAWIFTEEPFMEGLSFMSFGKLRGSYGSTGNDQIPDYGFYDSYSGRIGIVPNRLANPYYSWEINRKLEAAIALGFIDDRINLSVSWYRNRSSNQLVGYPLPAITGFTSIQANLPATLENRGWELELNTNNIQSGNFSWRSSFNISFPKNKLIEFPNIDQTSYATQYVVGKPLSLAFMNQYTGVDPVTGVYTVRDVNEDGRYDQDDKIIVKNRSKEYYGGINNDFTYKSFRLDFLFEFARQFAKTDSRFMSLLPGLNARNVSSALLDRWRQSGDKTDVQKYTQSFGNYSSWYNAAQSDAAYNSDASYIRLKTISLSYQLNTTLIEKIGLQACTIYFRAQNLFTLTKYEGWDPQNTTTSSLPNLRILTAGLQLKL